MVKFNKKALVLSTLSLSLATGALLVGCTTDTNNTNNTNKEESSVTSEPTVKNVDFTKLGTDIEESGLLTFNASSIPVNEFAPLYEVADKIEEGYASSALVSLQFQHVAVVKTNEPDVVTTALENYLKSDSVRPYADGYGNEANITSVKDAKIGTVGNYVYFVAAPKSAEIESLILDNLK